MDLCTTIMWLQALERLKETHPVEARQIESDLADPLNKIEAYIRPVAEWRIELLTPAEQVWRLAVKRLMLQRDLELQRIKRNLT